MNEPSYFRRYAKFFEEQRKAKGYDFHQASSGSVPPPHVTFLDKLRWWTWNRGERRKKIREERDRRVQEILQLKQVHQNKCDEFQVR